MEGRPIDTIGYRGMHSYEVAFRELVRPGRELIGGEDGLGRGFYSDGGVRERPAPDRARAVV